LDGPFVFDCLFQGVVLADVGLEVEFLHLLKDAKGMSLLVELVKVLALKHSWR